MWCRRIIGAVPLWRGHGKRNYLCHTPLPVDTAGWRITWSVSPYLGTRRMSAVGVDSGGQWPSSSDMLLIAYFAFHVPVPRAGCGVFRPPFCPRSNIPCAWVRERRGGDLWRLFNRPRASPFSAPSDFWFIHCWVWGGRYISMATRFVFLPWMEPAGDVSRVRRVAARGPGWMPAASQPVRRFVTK